MSPQESNINANPKLGAATSAGQRLPKSGVPRVALIGIVMGVVGIASFYGSSKLATEADPATRLHGTQKLVMPWHDSALHDTNGKVAQFKYRYRNAEGHMEDSPPPLNEMPIADIVSRR